MEKRKESELERKDGILLNYIFAYETLILILALVLPIKLIMDYWVIAWLAGLAVPIARFAGLAYLKKRYPS